MSENVSDGHRLSLLDLVIVVLSIYVLGALLIDTIYVLAPETIVLLDYIDTAICFIFFTEFCIRFFQSKNKLKYLKWGWIDLVSSIPAIGFLRVGRLFRLIRLLRIIRAFRSTKHFISHVFKNKVSGTFSSVLLVAFLLIIFSSIAILQVEKDPNSNIKTAEDALWWAYVTITTVGYGDKYPVTTEGRIIAGILMTGGVGLFGTFTAFVASWFVKDNKKHEEEEKSESIK